jgi:hypothetical protein
MKRTIEKLTQQRRNIEDDFKTQLEELKKRDNDLQKLIETVRTFQGTSQTVPAFEEIAEVVEQNLELNKKILSSFTSLLETTSNLMDAKDKACRHDFQEHGVAHRQTGRGLRRRQHAHEKVYPPQRETERTAHSS